MTQMDADDRVRQMTQMSGDDSGYADDGMGEMMVKKWVGGYGRRACGGLAALLMGASLATAPLSAQTPWETGQQGATWVNAFIDHAISERTALWFDGHWRRTGLGESPQQLLVRPGVQVTLAPGVRVGAGYAYVATAPYGRFPLADPLREQRIWQQLVFTHRAGRATIAHRYRWEQRWLSSITGNERSASTYQQRARYQIRAQSDLPSLSVRGRPVLAFVWDELLMPVGHGDATARLSQNRLGAGVGIPLGARQRAEVGYMNLWNAFTGLRANEVNHTLVLSYVWTGR